MSSSHLTYCLLPVCAGARGLAAQTSRLRALSGGTRVASKVEHARLRAAGAGFSQTLARDGPRPAAVRPALRQQRAALHQRADLARTAALTVEGRILAEVIAAGLLDHQPVGSA